MCAALTEYQAEFEKKFAEEFAKHFGTDPSEHRFDQPIPGGTITGSTRPISEKTSSFKESMEPPIPSGTPVFHFYFTGMDGVVLGNYIVKSFDEFLLLVPVLSAVSVLHSQFAHLTDHARSQISRSIAQLLNPPIQCTH
jgi:hypothetical protein